MSKKWVAPAVLAVIVLLAFFLFRRYHVAPSINLNSLSLTDLDGKPVKLTSYQGKKMLVCFSASWCGNCREELNTVTSIKHSDLQDVEVLVISDEPLEKIIQFKEGSAYPFTFLKMNKAFNEIGINAIPTSYIVNTRMEVKKETVGYLNWKDPSTLQHLKKLME